MTGKFPMKRYFGYSGSKCIDTDKSCCIKVHKSLLFLGCILRIAVVCAILYYICSALRDLYLLHHAVFSGGKAPKLENLDDFSVVLFWAF